MSDWVTIIVEEVNGLWSAWFKCMPRTINAYSSPAQAIERLLNDSGEHLFDVSTLLPIEECTRQGHLEFSMRHVGGDEFPRPSLN